MNKSELIEALAEAMNIPLREAASITNTIIETMSDALARGESIRNPRLRQFRCQGISVVYRQEPENRGKIKVKPKNCRSSKWARIFANR